MASLLSANTTAITIAANYATLPPSSPPPPPPYL